MAYLEIGSENCEMFPVSKISRYDFAEFSVKNTNLSESGSTIIYPLKMNKKRINFTAEFTDSEYHEFIEIVKNPEFFCNYKSPESENLISGIFTVTSEISVVKFLSKTAKNPPFYAVSATFEEV